MKPLTILQKRAYLKSTRFTLIHHLSAEHSLTLLLHIAQISLSGYYKHKKLIDTNNTKDAREQRDVAIVRNITHKHRNTYGYRRVTMCIRRTHKITMNHKKVWRLMRKYKLLASIRRKNPYKMMQRATQEHRTHTNILQRNFVGTHPWKKMGTDVSYLHYGDGKKAYISIVKDMITGELLSHIVSGSLAMGFVIETIQNMINTHRKQLQGSILHSDQGFHYTHPSYQKLLQDNHIIQSMSRKGNCLDNAPTESFFGHMKDELDLTQIHTLKELKTYVGNYIQYYNYERPQWNKKKMTPVEYRNHLMSIT